MFNRDCLCSWPRSIGTKRAATSRRRRKLFEFAVCSPESDSDREKATTESERADVFACQLSSVVCGEDADANADAQARAACPTLSCAKLANDRCSRISSFARAATRSQPEIERAIVSSTSRWWRRQCRDQRPESPERLPSSSCEATEASEQRKETGSGAPAVPGSNLK